MCVCVCVCVCVWVGGCGCGWACVLCVCITNIDSIYESKHRWHTMIYSIFSDMIIITTFTQPYTAEVCVCVCVCALHNITANISKERWHTMTFYF